MALCWTKLDNVDQALKSAEEALKLEPAHPKALYRRAAAFEKTSKFDEAKKDLNAVLKQNPEDKAALALAKRVDAQLARQKAKAKKMASKMFA
jgi:tetratricopeptide (TPR) repeat protein